MRHGCLSRALTSRWLTLVLAAVAAGLFFACLGRAGHWGTFEWVILLLCMLVLFVRFVFFRLW